MYLPVLRLLTSQHVVNFFYSDNPAGTQKMQGNSQQQQTARGEDTRSPDRFPACSPSVFDVLTSGTIRAAGALGRLDCV